MRQRYITGLVVALLLATAAASAGNISGTTISGSTATFGTGGEVTLDADGIEIASGAGNGNRVKWTGGGLIQHVASPSVLKLRPVVENFPQPVYAGSGC